MTRLGFLMQNQPIRTDVYFDSNVMIVRVNAKRSISKKAESEAITKLFVICVW